MGFPEDDYNGVWTEANRHPSPPRVHDTDLDIPEVVACDIDVAARLNSMWQLGTLGGDRASVELAVTAMAEGWQTAVKGLRDELADSDVVIQRWRSQAMQTRAEFRQALEAEQRRSSEHVVSAPARGQKPINTVKFDVRATYMSDAQPLLNELWRVYGEPAGRTFAVTHGSTDGNDLRIWVRYGPVRGGEKADVRRVLQRCAMATRVQLASAPEIEVLERVRHD